jgi:hypothetical protein
MAIIGTIGGGGVKSTSGIGASTTGTNTYTVPAGSYVTIHGYNATDSSGSLSVTQNGVAITLASGNTTVANLNYSVGAGAVITVVTGNSKFAAKWNGIKYTL